MTDTPDPTASAAASSNLQPRDSAALILVDRSGREPRVLLGRRNARVAFVPGTFVFPGGSVDPEDKNAPTAGALDAQCVRRLSLHVPKPSAAQARDLAIAAIRETFEEAGYLIGAPLSRQASRRSASPAWEPFVRRGLAANLAALRFVARAITPPGGKRRFDTRFFLADASAVVERVDGVAGPDAELIELVWATLPEAMALEVPYITRLVLRELATRLAADNPEAVPVPLFRGKWNTDRRVELP